MLASPCPSSLALLYLCNHISHSLCTSHHLLTLFSHSFLYSHFQTFLFSLLTCYHLPVPLFPCFTLPTQPQLPTTCSPSSLVSFFSYYTTHLNISDRSSITLPLNVNVYRMPRTTYLPLKLSNLSSPSLPLGLNTSYLIPPTPYLPSRLSADHLTNARFNPSEFFSSPSTLISEKDALPRYPTL